MENKNTNNNKQELITWAEKAQEENEKWVDQKVATNIHTNAADHEKLGDLKVVILRGRKIEKEIEGKPF